MGIIFVLGAVIVTILLLYADYSSQGSEHFVPKVNYPHKENLLPPVLTLLGMILLLLYYFF